MCSREQKGGRASKTARKMGKEKEICIESKREREREASCDLSIQTLRASGDLKSDKKGSRKERTRSKDQENHTSA